MHLYFECKLDKLHKKLSLKEVKIQDRDLVTCDVVKNEMTCRKTFPDMHAKIRMKSPDRKKSSRKSMVQCAMSSWKHFL